MLSNPLRNASSDARLASNSSSSALARYSLLVLTTRPTTTRFDIQDAASLSWLPSVTWQKGRWVWHQGNTLTAIHRSLSLLPLRMSGLDQQRDVVIIRRRTHDHAMSRLKLMFRDDAMGNRGTGSAKGDSADDRKGYCERSVPVHGRCSGTVLDKAILPLQSGDEL
jgi:hypothetical protein